MSAAPGTAADWVASRTPPAPPKLAERLTARLEARDAVDPAAITAACIDEAAALLAQLLAADCTTRDAALDLLAADALATYAFEAAGDAPERIDALAREAMARLSQLGEGATSV